MTGGSSGVTLKAVRGKLMLISYDAVRLGCFGRGGNLHGGAILSISFSAAKGL